MANGLALSRVITNELLHCEETHSERTRGGSSYLIPPGPRSRKSIQIIAPSTLFVSRYLQ